MVALDSNDEDVSIPQPVINWLFDVIQPIYHSKKTVFHDSIVVLSYCKQLRPRTRVYTDSNGVSQLLLCIYGKPEINSPVSLLIWIPQAYPIEHPIIYIDFESLKGSRIAPGKHVNPNGLISLSLFEKWDSKTCNLLHVVQECTKICRYDHLIDPVGLQNPNTYTPLPERIPPRPITGTPKPPLPEKTTFQVRSSTSNGHIGLLDKAPKTALSVSPPVLPQKTPLRPSLDLLDSPSENTDSMHKAILNDLRDALILMNEADSSYVKEGLQKRKFSIVSAQRQFESMYRYEADSLHNVQESIDVAKISLRSEIDLIQRYFDKIQLYEKENPNPVDLSSLAVAESLATEQLYELVSRDHALSDAIHLLTRLLGRDTINVDVFVKRTRQLGREQFFTRMHIHKITECLRN